MTNACPILSGINLAWLRRWFETVDLTHRKLADSSRDQSTEVKALQILSSSTNVYSTVTCISLLSHSFTTSAASLLQVQDLHSLRSNSGISSPSSAAV